MCTVSWLLQNKTYELFCNRDEQKVRAEARGPEVVESRSVRFISPLDHAGGTWIAVNQHGVSLCLLNGPALPSDKHESPAKSRGLIIMELVAATCVAEALDRALELPLLDYAPFRLIFLERKQSPVVVTWDGVARATVYDIGNLLSSSSVDDAGAQLAREQEFDRLKECGFASGPEAHLAFHRSHGAHASAYTPCMHRPDAETVSFTRIQVTPSEVLLHYSPGPPCHQRPAESRRLPIAS